MARQEESEKEAAVLFMVDRTAERFLDSGVEIAQQTSKFVAIALGTALLGVLGAMATDQIPSHLYPTVHSIASTIAWAIGVLLVWAVVTSFFLGSYAGALFRIGFAIRYGDTDQGQLAEKSLRRLFFAMIFSTLMLIGAYGMAIYSMYRALSLLAP